MEALHKNGMAEKLVYLNPTEPFNLYVKITLLAGLFVASPFVLYQLWMFISPGLYPVSYTHLKPVFSESGYTVCTNPLPKVVSPTIRPRSWS